MTNQKSRLAALITVMLVFSIMISLFVVPASAAVYETEICPAMVSRENFSASIYRALDADLHGYSNYIDLAIYVYGEGLVTAYSNTSGSILLCSNKMLERAINAYNLKFPDTPLTLGNRHFYTDSDGVLYYPFELYRIIPASDLMLDQNFTCTYEMSAVLTDTLDGTSFNGVLNHILELLPVVLVVIIGFIGLRKGISFIRSVLHSA